MRPHLPEDEQFHAITWRCFLLVIVLCVVGPTLLHFIGPH